MTAAADTLCLVATASTIELFIEILPCSTPIDSTAIPYLQCDNVLTAAAQSEKKRREFK
jgi:hypothetical protein